MKGSRSDDAGRLGSGTLFVFGDDGLETGSGPKTAKKKTGVQEKQELPPVMPALSPALGCMPVIGRADADFETEVRERPKTLSRRQRHSYMNDDDWCNDPEELAARREARKAGRSEGKPAKPAKPQPTLFARAVGFLARRDHSRKELEQKLRRYVDEDSGADEIEKVLERLVQAGYLSDERFARGRARVRATSTGDARIRSELRRHGVSGEDVAAAMDSIEESEEVRAWRIWRRRFSELPADRKERDRQIRYLLYRGFGMSAVSKVIRGEVEPPEEKSYWA